MNNRTWLSCCFTLATTLGLSDTTQAELNIEFYDDASNRIGTLLDYGAGSTATILMGNGFVIRYNTADGSISNVYLAYESSDCTGNPILYTNSTVGFDELFTGGQIYGIHKSNQVVKIAWLPQLREVEPLSMLDGQNCAGFVPNFETDYGLDVEPEAAANYGLSLVTGERVGFMPKLTAMPKQSGAIFCNGFENCPAN